MPTFAILGATGNTGQAILTLLLKDSSAKVHCFVRSAKKLQGQSPELRDNKRVKIFESSLNDIPALAECIAPCDAVFSCIATEENAPGCSIALDTAHAVVAAMSHIRCVHKSSAPLPRIIVLSSGTINDRLCREQPVLARYFVWTGFSYIYADLQRAETYYKLHRSWMTVIFVQPGGLVHDKQSGHAVTTEKEQTFLSYLDLAAGMIECGSKDRADTEWDWVGVSVIPTGKTRINFKAPLAILRGCVWTVLPPLYSIFHSVGLV
jgi:oxidoreductase AflX